MPTQTPIAALPYPLPSDPPKISNDIRLLAVALDSKLPISSIGDPNVGDGQLVYAANRNPTQYFRIKGAGLWHTLITGQDTGDWSLVGLTNPALYVRHPSSKGSMLVLGDRGLQAKAAGASPVSLYLNPHGGNILLGGPPVTPVTIDPTGVGIGAATAVPGLHVNKVGAKLRVQDAGNWVEIGGNRVIKASSTIDFEQDITLTGATASMVIRTGATSAAYVQLVGDAGRGLFAKSGSDYVDIQGHMLYATPYVEMGPLRVNGSVTAGSFNGTGNQWWLTRDGDGYINVWENTWFGGTAAQQVLQVKRSSRPAVPGQAPENINRTDFRLPVIADLGTAVVNFPLIVSTASWQVAIGTSTVEYKTDIQAMGQSAVWGLPAVTYTGMETDLPHDDTRLGFIAEEVVDVLGEEAALRYGDPEMEGDVYGKIYNFDDRAVLAHVVRGLQELRAVFDDTYQVPVSTYAEG